jgi:SAM-dependent methyltransferase
MSPNFQRRYFAGDGLDIGGKPDPLSLYIELFPLLNSVRTWDLEDGDAQFLESVQDNSYDFVHSSHCLEHLHDPKEGLANWFRVIRPGGFLVVTVPDEDLYEQGVFPSTHNRDHKWTFTIFKKESWSERSINLLELVPGLGEAAEVEKIELLNAGYRYQLPRYDQTLTPIGECAIELVIRKRTDAEIRSRGRKHSDAQPGAETRIHLNQYRDDLETLKANNEGRPPFTNDDEL